jgi:hypothetical protein
VIGQGTEEAVSRRLWDPPIGEGDRDRAGDIHGRAVAPEGERRCDRPRGSVQGELSGCGDGRGRAGCEGGPELRGLNQADRGIWVALGLQTGVELRCRLAVGGQSEEVDAQAGRSLDGLTPEAYRSQWINNQKPTLMAGGLRTGAQPVIPWPPARAAWSGTAAARRCQSRMVDHAIRVGVRQRTTSRLAAPGLVLTPRWSGNGCDRRADPSRRGEQLTDGSDPYLCWPRAVRQYEPGCVTDRPAALGLYGFDRGHRTRVLPCLVIRPQWTFGSDSRCLGSCQPMRSCSGRALRVTAPISATKVAASTPALVVLQGRPACHRVLLPRLGRGLRPGVSSNCMPTSRACSR